MSTLFPFGCTPPEGGRGIMEHRARVGLLIQGARIEPDTPQARAVEALGEELRLLHLRLKQLEKTCRK